MGLTGKSVVGLLAAGALTVAAGCGTSLRAANAASRPAGVAGAGATSQPAAGVADEFSPLPVPADFDRKKASLPLAQVPEDPAAPAKAGQLENAELPRQALRRIEESRRLFAEQRYSETIEELERALRYNANSHEAHQIMALAGLLSGDDERARASATRALAIKPDDLASHYVLGRLNEKARQLANARREYRLALKCGPVEAQTPYRVLTHYHLGNLLYEEQYYTAAIEQLTALEAGLGALGEKATENPELATLARVHRGTAAIRVARAHGLLGDYAAAAGSLKLAMTQSPQDQVLRGEYVRMLGRAGRMSEAGREAARFATDTKGNPEAVKLLLAVHRHAGNPEQALAVIRQLANAEPDNVELWKLYIDALSSAKRFDEAVTALNELVSRHPNATDSRWRLIQLTRERGGWSNWLKALAQQLKNEPGDSARVQEELSRLPLETARQMAAEIGRPAGERKLLPAEPTDEQAASALDVLLARLSARVQRQEQVLALFEQAIKRTPGFLPAVAGLAEQRVEACQWKETVSGIEASAKDLKAPSARLEYLLARAYDGLDETEPAIEHYKKAVGLDKSDAESMLALGRLYERTGRGSKDAQPMFQAAIMAAPKNMRARELLVRHLLKEAAQSGELAGRAAAEVKDMQRMAPQDPATVRTAALTTLVGQGEPGRKAFLETLRTLVQNGPEDTQSREDLVTTLLSFHEYATALEQAKELLGRRPCSAEAGELAATASVRLLDFPAAAGQLDQTLARYPKRESLLVLRAQVAMIQQDYDTAIKTYQRLLDFKYTSASKPTYRSALIDALREARRFDEGRRLIESWLAQTKEEGETRRFRMYLLALDAGAEDREQYLKRVREWLKTDPEDGTLRALLLGSETGATGPVGLIGMGRQDEAVLLCLGWLNQGLAGKSEKQPAGLLHDLRLLSPLLTALQAAERHGEAIEIARAQVSASKSKEERSFAQQILRAVYLRARKNDEAIALTQELLAGARQDSFSESRMLVNLLSQAGRHEEAVSQMNKLLENLEDQNERIKEFQKANENDPRRRQAVAQAMAELGERKALLLRTLSYVYQRMDQRDVAESRLREAQKLDPADVGINNDLGYLLADSGKDLEAAERMVRLALGQDPRTAAYQDSFAWVLYKKGDPAGARTWLLRATAMEEGQDPVVYDHLGDSQWRLGEKEAAVKSWRKSLQVYDRQVRSGETEVEKGVVERVKAKLEAAGAGGQPKVAPLAAESRPAE